MIKNIMLVFALVISTAVMAQHQPATAISKEYRAFATKEFDLIHTKLKASFNYQASELNGKAWVTVQPHFYETNTLTLDAKAMLIHKVQLQQASGAYIKLAYDYSDSLLLKIKLNKTYKATEKLTVYIEYTARPEEYKGEGSQAISDAKGLYFINPTGEDKTKPIQIWTQGETEATSVWLPTLDKPNQKSTQEFYLTVPQKYVSLSNGKLMSQTKNTDGTRTDYWKMDMPHAPYLFFMGVGDYAVIKDKYKNTELTYYVEPAYKDVAKKIFGGTPEMMKFFSEKVTGVEFPWVKYAQITGVDYVSGAMENTTATLHGAKAQQNARELVDGNEWESTVVHELFHQWFGDYVTAESWSNLTVNESFADYSEYLWDEYKNGKDAAAATHLMETNAYLRSPDAASKHLVRFYYNDKEDMFDVVTYQKGGRILHMLRNLVGDDAFFKSIHHYLTTNKLSTASAHKLRMSFEAVTGKDLNWFFNQWYYGSGHPKLTITNNYKDGVATLSVKQTQASGKLFTFPVKVDFYFNNHLKQTENIWINSKDTSIQLAVPEQPILVKFDADNVLLAEKTHEKNIAQYTVQYNQAAQYADRKEAIDAAAKQIEKADAVALLKTALNDKYFKLRMAAIKALAKNTIDESTQAIFYKLATADAHRLVRAQAIEALASTKKIAYKNLYVKNLTDSSYSVAGAALEALTKIDKEEAIKALPLLKKDMKGQLAEAVETLEILSKTEADFDSMYADFAGKELGKKFSALNNFITYLNVVNDVDKFKKAIDEIIVFRDQITTYSVRYKTVINEVLKQLADEKVNTVNAKQQIDYITEKIK